MKHASETDKDIWYVYGYDSEGDFVLIKDYDDKSVRPMMGWKNQDKKTTVTTTDIMEHAKVFFEKNDAERLIRWIKNNWVILNDEMVDYNDLQVGYKDKYDNIYDVNTERCVLINSDGDEIEESMQLSEAKEILKENGYRLITEESYELDEALEGPATSKQLWTLFKLTKQDYRNKNLSKEDAFKMIGELLDKKKNGETTTKPTNVNKATPKAPDADSPVKIGEIYHRNWGYSMCINDYYKVIDVKGKKALVVELPKKAISGDLTQGKVVPVDVENPSRNEAVLALIKPDGTLRIKNSIHKYETFHQWDGEPDWEDHWD